LVGRRSQILLASFPFKDLIILNINLTFLNLISLSEILCHSNRKGVKVNQPSDKHNGEKEVIAAKRMLKDVGIKTHLIPTPKIFIER